MAFARTNETGPTNIVGTDYRPAFTLLDCIDRAVVSTPAKTALVSYRSDGTANRLTYRELDAIFSTLAARLRALGVKRGDVVSFQIPNWWEFAVIHLACLKIGAVSNPLLMIYRERELRFMLRRARSKVLIVPATFRGFDYHAMAESLRPDLPDLDRVFIVGSDGNDAFSSLLARPSEELFEWSEAELRAEPEDIIQILYTSGTTGEPKGVMHSSNTMLASLVPFAERFGLGANEIVHMPSPIGHQLGFMFGVVLPLMLGATSVLQDLFDPAEMARQVRSEGVTFTMGATPFLNDFVNHVEKHGAGPSTLRLFVVGGAPIPRGLVSRAREVIGASVISSWGMTENGAPTTTCLDDPEEIATNTDGCPLPGMEVKVVDAEGEAVPFNIEGRLMVRGCSNFVGYLGQPPLERGTWFDTGDIARMSENGYIRISGRSKDIIIRGGENIPVVEVENLLLRHPAIEDVAVVGFPDPRLGERACAFVVPRGTLPPKLEDIVTYLKEQKMAIQYIPERIEIVPALPRTPSGKVQKFKLREMSS